MHFISYNDKIKVFLVEKDIERKLCDRRHPEIYSEIGR